MRDCARRLHEQAQPRRDAEPPLVAVAVDALPVHMFEREVGLAVGRDAGVVQARDVRVVERGQDLALARDARGQIAAERAERQLQRDAALHQPIGALGEPHRAHAADTELTHQPVRADRITRRMRALQLPRPRWRRRRPASAACAAASRSPASRRAPAGREACLSDRRAAQAGPPARRRDPAAAGRAPSSSSGLTRDQVAASMPRSPGHPDRQAPSARDSSSRAFSQSRRTVRSEMPSACAICTSVRPAK